MKLVHTLEQSGRMVQRLHLRRRGSRLLVLSVTALLALVSFSAAGASASSNAPLSLTVGVPSPSTGNSDFFWALEKGIWTQLGLNVTVVSQGSSETTNLAAGRLPVGNWGTTGLFPIIQSGRTVQDVFNTGSGDAADAITVKKGAAYTTVQSLSGQTVGVIGSAGQGFGAASSYSHYIVTHGGKALNIVVEPNEAAITAALESGQIQAAIANPAFGAGISAGLLTQMLAANSKTAEQITGTGVAAAAYFGLSTAMKSDSAAITRFIAGMRIANDQIDKASNAEIAGVLAKNSNFAPSVESHAALVQQVAEARPFFAANDGYISSATWKTSLKAFANWGLSQSGANVDLNAAANSYGQAVNMSYWNAATPLVKKFGTNGGK